MDVSFADSLPLFKSLLKSENASLKQSDGTFPKPNQSSLYKCLFHESFDAHDALEDAVALRKIIFSSPLDLPEKSIVENCSMVTTTHAADTMKYLDHRHMLLQSLSGRLFNPGPIKKQIAEKIAGSGLAYDDLQRVFTEFGKDGLIGILSKLPSSRPTSSRVTRNTRILAAIFKYFRDGP